MSLREKTVKGVAWTSIGTLGTGVIGFLVTLIMARHLTPEDFGTIEIILSFIVLSEVLVDCGISQALVREEKVTQSDLSTVFFLNLIIAVFIYSGLSILAPFIGHYYNSDSFVLMFRILSLKIVIDSIALCQNANFTRQMQFSLLARISLFSMLVSGIVSVGSIFLGFGIWAIIIYYLGNSLLRTLSIIISSRWLPSLMFNTEKLRYYLGFGGSLMILRIVDKAITSFESLSVGKAYSKGELGYFSQARKFDALVIQNLVGIIQKVTYPALSQVGSEEHIKASYRDVMRVSIWVITPVAILLFFFAEPFMCVVFGPRWLPSSMFLRIFSVFSMLYPLYIICWNVFLVKGRTDTMLYIGMGKNIIRLIVIFIMINFSLMSFAISIISIMLLSALIYIYFSGRLINYPLLEMIKDNLSTYICAIAAVGLAYIIALLSSISLFNVILFIIFIVLSAIIYIVFSIVCNNPAFVIVRSIFLNVFKTTIINR